MQYLLGGHRAFFFDYMDAMGVSRYLPVVVYPKGAPEKAAYFGHRLENFQRENNPFWPPEAVHLVRSVDIIQKAIEHIRKSGIKPRGIGVEMAFLPMDSGTALRRPSRTARSRMRCSCWSGCARARRRTSWKVARSRPKRDRVDAGGDRQARPGHHQAELAEALRREEPTAA